MLSRRTVLGAALAWSALPRLAHAELSPDEVLRQAIALEASNPVFLGATPLPEDDARWAEARAYLDAAPTGTFPHKVARYFDQAVPESFQERWPDAYANPLIVWFFLETRTKPEGDLTAWCAAFVSWCLERSGVASARSAASAAYRSWGEAAWSNGEALPGKAQPGDIAVFRQLSDPAHGHVGFFMGVDPQSDGRIMVLGGNQRTQGAVRKSHAVTHVSMRTTGNLELHSIRTAPGLRPAATS
ncbi:CHAP domain-containing protein [Devosia sp. A16]|uniref:CHAP domain-containing protein n=1 Tax=Devosia sp. A16 TaxID=1736675 RepID=UPI0006D7ECC2|nr:CHAP domain-containing protein [Devosia sp. A16]